MIVVLGYSDGGAGVIHPICLARVKRAETVATPSDVVVLSGFARIPGTRSEAELMADSWQGSARELVVDPDARTTAGNAYNALDDIRRAAAQQVVVVTSRWHAARAGTAFRLLLPAHVQVRTTYPAEPFSLRAALRELSLWPLLPIQLWQAGRQRRTDTPH